MENKVLLFLRFCYIVKRHSNWVRVWRTATPKIGLPGRTSHICQPQFCRLLPNPISTCMHGCG